MVGLLVLESVHEGLAKEAELVVDAVAEAGHVHGGERIEEAGGEASQAAVAEGGVGLLHGDLLEVGAELGEDRFGVAVEAEVGEVVAEGAAHEEFHGEVVEPLGVLLLVAPLALAHGVERRPPHGHGEGMQPLAHRRLAPDAAAPVAEEGLDAFAQVNEAPRGRGVGGGGGWAQSLNLGGL